MTATRLDGLTVVVRSGKTATRYEHYIGKVPSFASRLRTWGEAVVVKTRKKSTPKIGDQGVTCMFVGYNTDLGDDIYRMWNPNTKRIYRTRDIIWSKRMYYQVNLKKARQLVGNGIEVGENEGVTPDAIYEDGEDSNYEEDDHSPSNPCYDDEESDSDDEEDDYEEAGPVEKTTMSGRTVKTPRRLIEHAVLGMTHE